MDSNIGDTSNMDPTQKLEAYERVAQKSIRWENPRSKARGTQKAGLYHVDEYTSLSAKVDNLSNLVVSRLNLAGMEVPEGGTAEEANWVANQQYNPYNQKSKPGWRDHPTGSNKTEQMLEAIMASNARLETQLDLSNKRHDAAEEVARQHGAAIANLERQVGQIAQQLNERQRGMLPSDTVKNPREHVNAVMLRSGKQLGDRVAVPKKKKVAEKERSESEEDVLKEMEKEPKLREYVPKLPYPDRVKSPKEKSEERAGKFLAMLQKLDMNVSFLDALSQWPQFKTFLKKLCSSKGREEHLSEACSAAISTNLPKKRSDEGSFTIPCSINSKFLGKALADHGASINIMPFNLYKTLNLGELEPTCMNITLADRSVVYPRGIIRDIILGVGKFHFPVDFVIMDIDANADVPLILWRPFLTTSNAFIDSRDGELTLRVGDDKIVFKIEKFKKKKHDRACAVLHGFEVNNNDVDADLTILVRKLVESDLIEQAEEFEKRKRIAKEGIGDDEE